MKALIKGHTLAIGLAVGVALLFILVGLVLSGSLFCIIERKPIAKLNDIGEG